MKRSELKQLIKENILAMGIVTHQPINFLREEDEQEEAPVEEPTPEGTGYVIFSKTYQKGNIGIGLHFLSEEELQSKVNESTNYFAIQLDDFLATAKAFSTKKDGSSVNVPRFIGQKQ